ncbi:MAG: dienelactone hydrolase family protein [Deltaproteobacteria bacterium]|nr:dienelactone hydrolase family protein [Deltaproteobacteria bacterium]
MLVLPGKTAGMVIFAHGSGSSRLSPRNAFVARTLQEAGIGTLLFDLLTEEEDLIYRKRFDIDLIADRLIRATRWLIERPETKGMIPGYFGASTGAAAALKAAAALSPKIKAVVSRGGRPDLAMDSLAEVKAPTLLIVGEKDEVVLGMNREAYEELASPKRIEIVPGASHLFEEPGALEEVARLAVEWFRRHLTP